jgi:hypothetical protein
MRARANVTRVWRVDTKVSFGGLPHTIADLVGDRGRTDEIEGATRLTGSGIYTEWEVTFHAKTIDKGGAR